MHPLGGKSKTNWMKSITVKWLHTVTEINIVPFIFPLITVSCYCRIPFPLPPPWQEHAGRPCASAAALCHFWGGSCCLPGGLPQREHHSGASALYTHTPTGKLVLAGRPESDHVVVVVFVSLPTIALTPSVWTQIGFVLYPPSGPEWDMKDHNNMMFITMCYSWHLAFSMLIVSVLYCTVSWWETTQADASLFVSEVIHTHPHWEKQLECL